ncbi:MAG: SH3 domain-containing protein [Zetaproteobacteria bacterium]|nr:MAG: SH3 domain-containing protein [Zetaproteobacteria bacterium]
MGRLIPVAVALLLGGCAAAGTLAALPGVLVEEIVDQFRGAERTVPADIHRSLAAAQRGLRSLHLDADLLEQLDGGYAILFSNDHMDGKILLRPDTPSLTTLYIQVHRGMSRESSVEEAILDVIEKMVPGMPRHARFDFHGYGRIYDKVARNAKRIGWFRIGARLEVAESGTGGWLRTRLPSGRKGYMQASISQFRAKRHRKGG